MENEGVESPAWLTLLTAVAVTVPLLYWRRFRGRSSENALARSILLAVGFTAAVVVVGKVTL